MNTPFKITAVNGSHRSEKGISNILLNTFLTGARKACAGADVVYSAKMKMHPCKACYQCIFDTPGQCCHRDEMSSFLSTLSDTDLLVLAVPVYFDTMPGSMKQMVDRLMPLLGTCFEFREKRTYHLPATPGQMKVVIISTCGNPERATFKSMSRTFRRIIDNMGWQLLGEFFFPSSHMVATHPQILKPQVKALTQAGTEAVSGQTINEETIAAANADYIDNPAGVIDRMNQMFQEIKQQRSAQFTRPGPDLG